MINLNALLSEQPVTKVTVVVMAIDDYTGQIKRAVGGAMEAEYQIINRKFSQPQFTVNQAGP